MSVKPDAFPDLLHDVADSAARRCRRWASRRPRGAGPPPAFRLGVPLSSLRLRPAVALTLRRLPTLHLPQAIRLPAVALVVPRGAKGLAAPFPQTPSPSQPALPGRANSVCGKIGMSHGRVCSLGSARGGGMSSSGTSGSVLNSPFAPRSSRRIPKEKQASCSYQDDQWKRRKPGRRRLRSARRRRTPTK